MKLDFDKELKVCEAAAKGGHDAFWTFEAQARRGYPEALRRLKRLREIMARCWECGGWNDVDAEDIGELLNLKEV